MVLAGRHGDGDGLAVGVPRRGRPHRGSAAWALAGPLFRFSDTWQLVVNTGTTVATFLMVFLIQNTQNRDARALHLKLDELLRASAVARDELIDVEEGTDAQLAALQGTYRALRAQAPRGAAPDAGGAPGR